MKPIAQTTFGDKRGNCFAACVASILELDLTEVPNFCVDYPDGGDWWPPFNEWLKKRGLWALCFPVAAHEARAILNGAPCPYPSPVIVGGTTADGIGHAVVWHADGIWNTNRETIPELVKVDMVTVLLALKPERSRRTVCNCGLFEDLDDGDPVPTASHHSTYCPEWSAECTCPNGPRAWHEEGCPRRAP